MCVRGHEYALRIINAADGRPSELECCPTLQHLLAPHKATLQARLAQSSTAPAFLVELEEVLDGVLRAHPPHAAPAVRFFSRLLEELDVMGWGQLVALDPSLTALQLRRADEHGRQHVVSVTLPPNYPAAPPLCSTELPEPLTLRWSTGCTLRDLLAQFGEVRA